MMTKKEKRNYRNQNGIWKQEIVHWRTQRLVWLMFMVIIYEVVGILLRSEISTYPYAGQRAPNGLPE